MNRAFRRLTRKLGLTAKQANVLMTKAMAYAAAANYNIGRAWQLVKAGEPGAVNVQAIIMIFIAIVIIYQLIPQISSDNQTVQNSANASSMAKFSAALGEWMFPLLGIIAVVFLLFKGKRGNKGDMA